MDIQRLKTLRELSLRGTMAAVADAISISPSAVSQQISMLEDELRVALIERRGRGVTLTPAGEVLVAYAGRLLAIVEEAKTDLAEMKRAISGELVLSSFPSIAASLLPRALRELQLSYPDLMVAASEMEPSMGLAALRSWQIDLAIVDDLTLKADKNLDAIETYPIYEDHIVAVMHASHPLAHQRGLSLTDFEQEYWAIDARPNTFSDMLFGMCAQRGFTPKVVSRFDAVDLMLPLVENCCAIALLPRIRVMAHHENLVALQFIPPIRRSIFLAIRRGESRRPPLNALLTKLQEHAKNLSSHPVDDLEGIRR